MQLIIGGIIGFLIGAAILFFVQKSKIDRKEKQLQRMQKKLEQSEQDYENRLQSTVMSLQSESERQTSEKVEKLKQKNQVAIEELEQKNINKIEELERANFNQIDKLEKSYEAKNQELEEAHEAKIQELKASHKIKLEETVNSLKQEYENKLKQLDRAKEETKKNQAKAFDDLLEGLPSLDNIDVDEEGFNEILTVSDEEKDYFSDGETGLTELLKITPENLSLQKTDLTVADNNDEIQQLANFFEDLPAFDEEGLGLDLELEGETNQTKNNDSVLNNDSLLDLEQKPLEEEIKRLSDLLDAFPPITEDKDSENNNNNNQ